MSTGTQVDLDWAGTDAAQGGASVPPASAPNTGATGATYLTDEEILGIEPVGGGAFTHHAVIPSEARNLSSIDDAGNSGAQRDSSGKGGPRNDNVAEASKPRNDNIQGTTTGQGALAQMPEWMRTLAADPKHGGEAQQLWREHQEFRAAFSSSEEARAIKELLPGGVKDVLSLREATQSVERIDAALFSGDARAQSEVVAELARANPAAFRSMFAEAAKVLAGMGQSLGAGGRGQVAGNLDGAGADAGEMNGGPTLRSGSGQALRENREGWSTLNQNQPQNQSGPQNQVWGDQSIANGPAAGPTLHSGSGPTLRKNGEGWGTQSQIQNQNQTQNQTQNQNQTGRQAGGPNESPVTSHQSPVTNHDSQITNHDSPRFDPAAYASFERATNDEVARDVRGSIGDTLARVMPEGVAEGAARRIGEDIFNEVHRALAADRNLSEQVAGVLRDRRFGGAEQQRVASLLAGRAKQLVPSVARRVIGEWTSTVLNTSRSKAARQAAAASRVDIAAPGGSLDSMPLRQMSAREVNYASMSDEEILGM